MNQTKRRPAGMVAINAQLTAIAGQPATLKQLMACLKTSATLRRAWRNARAALVESPPHAPLPAPAQPQQPAPEPAPAPTPEPLKWGPSTGTFGGGLSWGGTQK